MKIGCPDSCDTALCAVWVHCFHSGNCPLNKHRIYMNCLMSQRSHYSCPYQSRKLYFEPKVTHIWKQILLSWTHSPPLPVMAAHQQASCDWINLPVWLLIRRWVSHYPPPPKLISLCHCMTPLPITPADTHACTHVAKYLHLSLSYLHGIAQKGGRLVRRRKVSALKEFIILRWQSCYLREQMKGSGRRRGWERGRE